MKTVNEEKYTSEAIRALFVGENGERVVPTFTKLGIAIAEHLVEHSKNKYLMSNCFISCDGVNLEWDDLYKSSPSDVEINGWNVIFTVDNLFQEWAKRNRNNEFNGEEFQPLITTQIMADVIVRFNDPLKLSSGYFTTVETEFTEGSTYAYYNDFTGDSIYPECDFSQFEKDWKDFDSGNLIEVLGEVITLLNYNLPEWVVGTESLKLVSNA